MTFTTLLGKLFGSGQSKERVVMTVTVDGAAQEDNYATPNKCNTELARQLYRNINQDYALSAQLVKPIINNNVNFIGTPKIYGNAKALKVLNSIKIPYHKIHKAIEIDGDLLIWPQWNMEKGTVELITVPVECIHRVFVDPITKKITGYKLVDKITYADTQHDLLRAEIQHIVTDKTIVRKIIADDPMLAKETTFRNPFGVMPLVLFSNDKALNAIFGHSELEVIEPQLKFYHDLTYEAGAAQKRDGHPKLKVTTKNPKQWIDNNFGAGTFDNIRAGKASISMTDRDLYVNSEGEDVNYLYLNKVSGDFKTLSEVTFTNLVEGSETPEINFGANIGTSLASVKEYRPVWIKKIQAKQADRTEPWLELYKHIIMIHNYVKLTNVKSDDLSIVWEKPNFVSTKEQSEIINAFSKALVSMKDKMLLTDEEIYNTLKELGVVQIAETFEEHQKEIERLKKENEEKARKLAESNTEEAAEPTDEESEEEEADTESESTD